MWGFVKSYARAWLCALFFNRILLLDGPNDQWTWIDRKVIRRFGWHSRSQSSRVYRKPKFVHREITRTLGEVDLRTSFFFYFASWNLFVPTGVLFQRVHLNNNWMVRYVHKTNSTVLSRSGAKTVSEYNVGKRFIIFGPYNNNSCKIHGPSKRAFTSEACGSDRPV